MSNRPCSACDAVKQRPYLLVVGVVTGDGDPCAARLRNGRGDLSQRAAQSAGTCARLHRTACYVNRCTGFTEAEGDTLADPTRGAGDEGNTTFESVREVVHR